eukprot:s2900_g9.t1
MTQVQKRQFCSPGGQQPPIPCRGHGCAKAKGGGVSLAGTALDVGLVGLVGCRASLGLGPVRFLGGFGGKPTNGGFRTHAPKHQISCVIRSRFHVAYVLAVQKHPCVLWPPIIPRESQ